MELLIEILGIILFCTQRDKLASGSSGGGAGGRGGGGRGAGYAGLLQLLPAGRQIPARISGRGGGQRQRGV